MDAWVTIDDVGQARERCRGKVVHDITETSARGRSNHGLITITFTDGTTLEVRSPDLMILEVGYAQKPR